MGLEDGNYRVEIFIHLIRSNQEQLRKTQLCIPLAGIEPIRPCDSGAALYPTELKSLVDSFALYKSSESPFVLNVWEHD